MEIIHAIKTLFAQTARIFVIMSVGIGFLYTVLVVTKGTILPMFDVGDNFYELFDFLQNIEIVLWGVIGAALLFSVLRAVIHLFLVAARYVNNDSFVSDDQFGRF